MLLGDSPGFASDYPCRPQCLDNPAAKSSSASSPPDQPMNDSPTGQPETVPIGIVTCGRPLSPEMQVNRMTFARNGSSASGGVSVRGETPGARECRARVEAAGVR